MLQLLVMCFIAGVCGTLMLLVWKPKTKFTLEQLKREEYVLEEQNAIDIQAHMYRATIIRTNASGKVSYKEVLVDEHIVYQAISNNNRA